MRKFGMRTIQSRLPASLRRAAKQYASANDTTLSAWAAVAIEKFLANVPQDFIWQPAAARSVAGAEEDHWVAVNICISDDLGSKIDVARQAMGRSSAEIALNAIAQRAIAAEEIEIDDGDFVFDASWQCRKDFPGETPAERVEAAMAALDENLQLLTPAELETVAAELTQVWVRAALLAGR